MFWLSSICVSLSNTLPLFIGTMKAGCRNWLLRSPDTSEYDLLKVVGNWKVWVGVIGKADVSIATNLCNDETDCNLHGQCVDQECICDHEDGVSSSLCYGPLFNTSGELAPNF